VSAAAGAAAAAPAVAAAGPLSGKVVVVTGATRGIGRAIADAAARKGASVVVCSRTADAVERTLGELASQGANACGLPADVADFAQLEAVRDAALEQFGRIDVWVSNAGIANGYRPLDEESVEELHDIVAINILGHMYSAKLMVPYFREHGGYLMNMAGRGWKGEATPYTASYAATKAAIASLTKSLAAENKDAKNVSINAFVPGMVDTDFYTDMKVSPRLEDSAHGVRFALEAFGTPLEEVGERCTTLIAEKPGRTTGRIYPMLTTSRVIVGGAKMAWWGMSGRMKRA
jgi:NAD(P)-dependent dehydrogenase (short-subunit alcohol dehydrogenase family)